MASKLGSTWGLRYWAQYFLIDGGTNVSLDGRDTISIAGGHRRHEAIVNLEPYVKLGDRGEWQGGVSAQYFRTDIPAAPSVEKLEDDVWRAALHSKVSFAGFGLWGEYLYQRGKHVNAFPILAIPATETAAAVPGRASGDNHYALVRAEYAWGPLSARYNLSFVRYAAVDVQEVFHVPALGVRPHSSLSLLAELVLWNRFFDKGHARVDRSLNLTLNASF